jgi:hypothetical protein
MNDGTRPTEGDHLARQQQGTLDSSFHVPRRHPPLTRWSPGNSGAKHFATLRN